MRRDDEFRFSAGNAERSREALRDLAPLRRGGLFLAALATIVMAPLVLAPLANRTDMVAPSQGPLAIDRATSHLAQARIAQVWGGEAQARLAHATPGDPTRLAALFEASLIR